MSLSKKILPAHFCWELIPILVDPSESQTYTEDCSVCCHPILIKTEIFGEDISILATQEDEGF